MSYSNNIYFFEWVEERGGYKPLFEYTGDFSVDVFMPTSDMKGRTDLDVRNIDLPIADRSYFYSGENYKKEFGMIWTEHFIESSRGAIIERMYIAPKCIFKSSEDLRIKFSTFVNRVMDRLSSDTLDELSFDNDAYAYYVENEFGLLMFEEKENSVTPFGLEPAKIFKILGDDINEQLFISIDIESGEVDDFIP